MQLPADAVWVHGDGVRLTQIIGNLLNNAARYTPPGGTIRVSLAHVAQEACISVRDTGVGLMQLAVRACLTSFSAENNLRASALACLSPVAYDGPSALQVFTPYAPSLVILDIGMPVMDGYQLARELRSQFPSHDFKIAGVGRKKKTDGVDVKLGLTLT